MRKEQIEKIHFNNQRVTIKPPSYLIPNLIFKIILMFAFSVSAYYCYIKAVSFKKSDVISYTEKSTLDYKVFLKENDFFEEEFLPKDRQYIASLIEDINIDFNYIFSLNHKMDYTYKYYIDADVIVTDKNNSENVIFNKTERLVDETDYDVVDSNNAVIYKNIVIKYDEYNNLIRSFKNNYSLLADSNLVLTMHIIVNDHSKEKLININDSIKITIPLSEQMINVKMDYKNINNSNKIITNKSLEINDSMYLSLFILSDILVAIMIVNIFCFIRKNKKKKSIYEKELNRILKEYDRIIVESKNRLSLKLDNCEVIQTKTFEELLDVRDNLERPIIHIEITPGQKSIFLIKCDDQIFAYVLKASSFNKG